MCFPIWYVEAGCKISEFEQKNSGEENNTNGKQMMYGNIQSRLDIQSFLILLARKEIQDVTRTYFAGSDQRKSLSLSRGTYQPLM